MGSSRSCQLEPQHTRKNSRPLTITGIHPVSLSIVDDDPVSIQLGHAVRRPRVERCRLLLRCLDDLAVEFRSRSLIESRVLFQSARADRIQKPQGSQPIDISSVLGHLEADLDMRLSAEVIDFRRLDL